MIIDIHSHVCAAPQLYRFKANLMASRGQPPHGFKCDSFSDEFVRDHSETKKNLRAMETVGTDLQFLSPRPYQLMHGERPVKLVEAWAIANHDYIAQQVRLFPAKFRGVCGLPQVGGEPVSVAFPELERCVTELGFIGTLIDTDPGEGDLKIIVAHGGGSIPYQIGRWQADWILHGGGKNLDVFNQRLKKIYFDTCLHYKKSLELLIGLAGSDRVLFGTENPGSGSAPNPETGRNFDDIRPLIESIDFLTAQDRQNIFEDNARRLFSRLT